ncbi:MULTISPECIES: MalY/PatB family protein [Yersinia pseudotuberculosis complex]|uniref:cysteine-S-conjugate beta-lyase n=1 Tax=Yersinia pseudotuberculosis serotype O:1b (strain IP 31758) TaxID=349747 RepID=A0A0U1R0S7_YERP3|nr:MULTISPECIES: MalY/PatB family protein [Yersinia pseudotuberculosis complex]ABS48747.1 aminotransferase, classes I and II [Yersinia pseudotuberculosis IP 31758]AJJ70009.1 C-S lyase family protein [Yersinia pseudotuberculosis]AJK15764.1 C-S lyase family protein [Yersinia pseudotuberculosis str. PA3606]AXY33761.1 pyridoxal phosphate-dependent aminotransferase [Yersinia pseudotuberculosis]AYX13454.1 pyridoxal phosphate-dependent aminotransferase [Yersinia pseudotuberculosis]
MDYNFDEVIDRSNTACEKWDAHYLNARFGMTDLTPMWVADMDFRSPDSVISALSERVNHGIYGYTFRPDSFLDAITQWVKKRHQWLIKPEWISHSPGVVPGLAMAIRGLTKPGDKILIQSPVYHHFANVIARNDREVVASELLYGNEKYDIDFAHFEACIATGVKLFILCNPHNPVGRVWTRDELTTMGNICLRHNVIVIADEIHCDIVFKGSKFTPFASISPDFENNSITCMAPSKTFNLLGTQTSAIIIPNQELRNKYETELNSLALGNPNPFGVIALETAYKEGEEWLESLLGYLQHNLDFAVDFFKKYIPKITLVKPEGTYLLWLDCRGLGLTPYELEQFILTKAKLALNEGHIFGESGENFMRMNIGCPKSVLTSALIQLKYAVDDLN